MPEGPMAEVARLSGRQESTCRRWSNVYSDFPPAISTLGTSRVKYELNDVAVFLMNHPELVTELGTLWNAARAALDARERREVAEEQESSRSYSQGPRRVAGGYRQTDGRITKTKRPGTASRPVRRERLAFLAAHPHCVHCGHGAADVIDHITPLSRGGSETDPSNWQSSHGVIGCPQCGRKCNSEKGNKLDSEMRTVRNSIDWFAGKEGLA